MSNKCFLQPEDFELFAKYGKKYGSEYPEAHTLLRQLYDKLGVLADGMRKYGYIPHIRRNPKNQGQRYEEYHWAQLTPEYSRDSESIIFFVVDFTSEGLGLHIDCNQRAGYQPTELAKNLMSWEQISVQDVCGLSEHEIIQRINSYCNNNKRNFLLYGREFGIKTCINLINMEEYISLLKGNNNLIFTGAPGTGKTYLAKQLAAQIILGKEFKEKTASDEEKNKMKEQCGFVQFHPSYDYTDFVEGLRPKQDEAGNVGFERKDGVFKAFCKRAIKSKSESSKYVFIIDEINRGDMSKIFGELFFSIDPGYRGTKGLVNTQYQNLIEEDDVFKAGFYVPENIYIIGTMNDIDRSVESMDFAMRRRFAFKEIHAEDRMDMIKENPKLAQHYSDIEQRMRNLNIAILTIQSLSTAYQIGAAYYLKLENYLTDDGNIDDSSWEKLWDNHLYGLLFEYLRGLPDADDDMKTLRRAFYLKDIYDMKDDKPIKVTENA